MMLGGSLAALFPDASRTQVPVALEVRELLTEQLAAPVDLDVAAG